MTDERPQPPQDEPAAASQAPKRDQPEEAKAPEDMRYAQYLKLTHPEKSDEEIAKMVRKENRYTWLVPVSYTHLDVYKRQPSTS